MENSSLPKWLQSSDGTGRLSSRVSAILTGFLPALLLVAQLFGFSISTLEGQEAVTLIINLVAGVESLVAIVWLIKAWADRNFRKENHQGAFADKVE